MNDVSTKLDYFISYNKADADYAVAIRDALAGAGLKAFLHQEDIPKGGHFPSEMDDAITEANQMICLFSPDYFDPKAVYSAAERYAAWRKDPLGKGQRIVPVLVRDCTPTDLFGALTRINVTAMSAPEAGTHVAAELTSKTWADDRHNLIVAGSKPQIHNVPRHRLAHFIGRGIALDQLHQRLDQGSNVAVTAVSGMGGIGKTTLAAEYAHRFGTQGRYAGVWWLAAETSTGIVDGFARLAKRLGIPEQQDQGAMARAAIEAIGAAKEPWLIVFDNLPNRAALRTHGPDGEDLSWLPGGRSRVLITSRKPNFGSDAHDLPLDFWPDDVAAGYLLTIGKRTDEDGALTLAKDLGGLPLAIDQAATYLASRGSVSFQDYADRLQDMLARTPDPDDAGDYEKPVYAALILGLEGLSEAAQDLLCMLSWLSPDGCDLWLLKWGASKDRSKEYIPDPLGEALRDEIVCGDLMKEIQDGSFIRTAGEGEGLTPITHRINQAVLRRWQTVENRTGWDAHATELVNAVFPADPQQPSTWELCETLMPHAMALVLHGPRTGQPAKALGLLLNQAGVFRHARGDTEGAIAMMEPSVDLARETHGPRHTDFLAGLSNLSGQYTDAGRFEEAEAGFLEVLEIGEEEFGPTHPNIAIRLNNLAEVYWKQKDFARAEPLFQRALEVFRQNHGNTSSEVATGLNSLGALYDDWAEETGDEDLRAQALDLNEQAISTARAALGERHPGVSQCLHNLAVHLNRTGDPERASGQELRAAAIMVSLGLMDHPHTLQRLNHLLHLWEQAGQGDRKDNLGNFVIPEVLAVEMEMMKWVNEDPDNRHFGPKSFFAGKPDELEFAKNALGIEGNINLPGVES